MKFHKTLFALSATIIILSCSSKIDLKEITKNYIRDSILVRFNDPKSFEFVDIKFDSINSHSMIESEIESLESDLKIKNMDLELNKKNMEYSDFDDLNSYKKIDGLTKSTIKLLKESILECETNLKKPNKLDHINTHVTYRAKNKFGALILDEMFLTYNPYEKKFSLINLQE